MQKARKKTMLQKVVVFAVGVSISIGSIGSVSENKDIKYAKAEEENEVIYHDDIYGEDELYHGTGTTTSATYYVVCDEMRIEEKVWIAAPSYGNNDSALRSTCGPISGTNVVVYYDQFCPNLIPNFEPGMMIPAGYYDYFPDLAWNETTTVLENLYSLMRIEELGGATSSTFRGALNTFASNKGYTFSYSSFYSSSTSVNLNVLTSALNQSRVGVIMCSQYNYISSIAYNQSSGQAQIVQNNSTVAHIMMVHGYQKVGYYINGQKIKTETFLFVSSGYSSAEHGYMKLNDFSDIDEAWIMVIS